MRTLNAPIYEVRKGSELYNAEKKRLEGSVIFWKSFKEKYGATEGFTYYDYRNFGVEINSPTYEIFKDSTKESNSSGYCPIKTESILYKEISSMLKEVEQRDDLKLDMVFGIFNIVSSQWVEDRLFFQVKNESFYTNEDFWTHEITPTVHDDYLKLFKDKHKTTDQLLDEYNDYLSLYKEFGDNEYKLKAEGIMKTIIEVVKLA